MSIDLTDPATLANEYLELARRIEDAEARQALLKENLKNLLPQPVVEAEAPKWTYGDAIVQWVKGRKTTKVDTTKLRKVLVLAGVDLSIIEGAFEAATTESLGAPSLRVSRKE
jgi:hypothetical protein